MCYLLHCVSALQDHNLCNKRVYLSRVKYKFVLNWFLFVQFFTVLHEINIRYFLFMNMYNFPYCSGGKKHEILPSNHHVTVSLTSRHRRQFGTTFSATVCHSNYISNSLRWKQRFLQLIITILQWKYKINMDMKYKKRQINKTNIAGSSRDSNTEPPYY